MALFILPTAHRLGQPRSYYSVLSARAAPLLDITGQLDELVIQPAAIRRLRRQGGGA